MSKRKILMLTLILLINLLCDTGCWNYREIDKMAIVAGVAIDKSKDGQYMITPEIIAISGGKETKATSKTVNIEGQTIFDAARNAISILGKRAFWSHTKVIILSKEVANENLEGVIDWYVRDSETRENVSLLISEAASAREIFEGQGTTEEIKSFIMEEILTSQTSLSKVPVTDVLQLYIESKTEGESAIVPTVNLRQADGKMIPQIMGAAIIKNRKLAGFLSGEETQAVLFVRDDVKAGVLVENTQQESPGPPVSLEIFGSKTKITPVVSDGQIELNLNVDVTVAIDEIEGDENYIDDAGRTKLERIAANTLKKRIESIIKKVQQEYDADIFRFAQTMQEDNPKAWRLVSSDWDQVFQDLKVNVQTKVHIKNSAVISKSFEEGE